jgi:hypothetical protein
MILFLQLLLLLPLLLLLLLQNLSHICSTMDRVCAAMPMGSLSFFNYLQSRCLETYHEQAIMTLTLITV